MAGREEQRRQALDAGRAAHARREWLTAYDRLSVADQVSALEASDLERLAVTAQLLGRDDDGLEQWERAHQAALTDGDIPRAVRCAFWLSMGLLNRRETSRGAGWLARAARLLEESAVDCAERGYVLVPTARRQLIEGDQTAAAETFGHVARIAVRFGDDDLLTLARLGLGQASIHAGDVSAGVPLLDEAMVSVTTGDVSPIVVGIVYCGVVEACHGIFDVRRATEWTAALTRWCEVNADIVAFRGECHLYRSEVMRVQGQWAEALDEAYRAQELLARPPTSPDLGAAFYEMAEIHRLRGEHDEAEADFRRAHQHGHSPQPGLARLRSVEGRTDAAVRMIGNAVAEAPDDVARCRLLPAHVEILLAAGDGDAARRGAAELARIAATWDRPSLSAAAAYAQGRVLLAEGDAATALGPLRQARSVWQGEALAYDDERARVQIGIACQALGDTDMAALEYAAAQQVFRELGAKPDLTSLAAAMQPTTLDSTTTTAVAGLTNREVEVLRLIATGKTNRAIAADLVISEKTVARHVSNILTKLDLPSRSAATAFAYEHELMGRGLPAS